jgi:hypothetical protein
MRNYKKNYKWLNSYLKVDVYERLMEGIVPEEPKSKNMTKKEIQRAFHYFELYFPQKVIALILGRNYVTIHKFYRGKRFVTVARMYLSGELKHTTFRGLLFIKRALKKYYPWEDKRAELRAARARARSELLPGSKEEQSWDRLAGYLRGDNDKVW